MELEEAVKGVPDMFLSVPPVGLLYSVFQTNCLKIWNFHFKIKT